MYPLKFKPLYKDYVWGGRNLASLGKPLPAEGNVAESWEIACHKNGSSIVANGEYEGIPLPGLIKALGRKLIGEALPQQDVDKFPLLVKFIDAQENLSVQVHPDDGYALANENGEYGKTEMWYIISARPDAKLVYDVVPGTTRESFAEAVARNDVESCLNTIEVSAGDVIYIPAGMIHAIGKGIIIAEIQQNSDTTYRVYDYGRVGRELHIQKALDVINFSSAGTGKKCTGITLPLSAGSTRRIVVANRYFCTEIYDVSGSADDIADGSRFHIYVFVSGSGTIEWEEGRLPVRAGESVLIPAAMGKYALEGNMTALKTYKPDPEKDVLRPLLDAGFSEELVFSEIAGLRESLQHGLK
ncbi:MAG TPA: class I mannose-6-phosphate isomerase [Clostridiales bacterium]|nr:class I mannose-6-phosphate isomerase [Clostridiales bacterium]HPV02620.1 class I mannose-6-phosphate isomerase [Clostridiales bacterium]